MGARRYVHAFSECFKCIMISIAVLGYCVYNPMEVLRKQESTVSLHVCCVVDCRLLASRIMVKILPNLYHNHL